jgi:hypothetical protein
MKKTNNNFNISKIRSSYKPLTQNCIYTQSMKTGKLSISSLSILFTFLFFTNCSESKSKTDSNSALKTESKALQEGEELAEDEAIIGKIEYEPADTALYNKKLKELANGDTTGKWPVKKQPYPLPGAILPYKRVVTYYGNLYSKKMGAL